MKKRFLALLLTFAMSTTLLTDCGGSQSAASEAPTSEPAETEEQPVGELTPTQQIIKETQGITLEELAKKAIEESNGKIFYGVGNSSRGKTALPLFIAYLQTIDPLIQFKEDQGLTWGC